MIPKDEHGYSILGGEVHTRYAPHATSGRKVRTIVGLLNVGGALEPCPLCYPPAPKPRSRKPETRPIPVEVEVMAPDDVEAFSLRGPEVPTFGPTVESED